jgi:hypothetical protein
MFTVVEQFVIAEQQSKHSVLALTEVISKANLHICAAFLFSIVPFVLEKKLLLGFIEREDYLLSYLFIVLQVCGKRSRMLCDYMRTH